MPRFERSSLNSALCAFLLAAAGSGAYTSWALSTSDSARVYWAFAPPALLVAVVCTYGSAYGFVALALTPHLKNSCTLVDEHTLRCGSAALHALARRGRETNHSRILSRSNAPSDAPQLALTQSVAGLMVPAAARARQRQRDVDAHRFMEIAEVADVPLQLVNAAKLLLQ